MRHEEESQTHEPESREELPPLIKGQVLTQEESLERMYRVYEKTFEALAK